jgi:hypothetical protein
MMKKIKIVAAFLLLTSLVQAQNSHENNQQLYQVVEDFRTTIINQNDEEKFYNLFLHDSITWAAIVTGKYKEVVLAQKPDFTFQSTDYKSFLKMLETGDEEKFYDVKIAVRNEFATISFEYTFNKNGDIENWGTEYWSLILINDSWKITSVTWSMNLEKLEKCPFAADDYFVLK